jgi:hypothetical protein
MLKDIFIYQKKKNASTYSLFLAPSPESESDSSTSSLEVKRVKKINYFFGHGKKEWAPKDEVRKSVNIYN